MKAVVKTKPGFDNMVYMDIPEPEAAGDLVKIKVAYSGICGTDLHAFRGTYASTKPPVVLGHEFSGIVTAVGPDVKEIKVGDRVTSETTFATCGRCACCKTKDYNLCGHRQGLGTQINGSMAQYIVSREESVHLLPPQVSMLSASLIEPLACGVHASIEKGRVQAGDLVCVFGAGAIGQMVAQVCKAQGAKVIVADITSGKSRLEMAVANGADLAVDQMTEDLRQIVMDMTDGEGVDLAFECSGSVAAANRALEITRRKGTVVQMGVFATPKTEIWTDLILHHELNYIGSRSQRPSSWVKSIELLRRGIVVPEGIVSKVVTLENWREAYDMFLRGEGVKGVICCNEDIAES